MSFVFVSQSAASDLVGPDKHVNIVPVERLNTKLGKAATAFHAKVEKADKVALAALTKAGAKTAKQIERALSPIGYFYISTTAKPVPYSAAKEKANNTAYLRARAITVIVRKRPSTNPKHKLVCSIYNKFVVGAELYAEQMAFNKAVTAHKSQKEKTTNTIRKVNADKLVVIKQQFAGAKTKLMEALGGKIKENQIFEFDSPTGQPAIYLKFGTQVLVVRPSSVQQINKAKATAEKMGTKE